MNKTLSWEIPPNISKIVVDGANVAFASKIGNKADIRNLKLLLSLLRSVQKTHPGLRYEIICDASLHYKISDQKRYDRWLKTGAITQAPPSITADKFILVLAKKYDGKIMLISNDLYRDHPEVEDLMHRNQHGFVFAFGDIILRKIEVFPKSVLINIAEDQKKKGEILSIF